MLIGIGIILFVVLFSWFIWRVLSPVTFLKKCDCGNRLFLKTGENEYESDGKRITEHSFECLECGTGRIVPRTKGPWGIEIEVVS